MGELLVLKWTRKDIWIWCENSKSLLEDAEQKSGMMNVISSQCLLFGSSTLDRKLLSSGSECKLLEGRTLPRAFRGLQGALNS